MSDDVICNEKEILPVGKKFGCFTIIAGFEAYREERASKAISQLEEDRQRFINGEKCLRYHCQDVDAYDKSIEREKAREMYKVRCKCGKTDFMSANTLLRWKGRKKCGDDCGTKFYFDNGSHSKINLSNDNDEFIGHIHESLRVVACTDVHIVENPPSSFKKETPTKVLKREKMYRCQCHLCGKEYEFSPEQFKIRNDQYGPKATWGYYSEACCNCHTISSFQWRTLHILQEHNIPYRVEASFPELLSDKGYPLRYDFLIYNPDGSIKCLIECQGEQHYKLVPGCGGYSSLNSRQERDVQKQEYANAKGITLIEVPYNTCKTYDKEELFLKNAGVI